MLPFVIICKTVFSACRFQSTVSFWYSKPVIEEVNHFAKTYQLHVPQFRGVTFFGMAFVSWMSHSVRFHFANVLWYSCKFSFSEYSFWKLQLLNRAETERRKSRGWSREFMMVARKHSWEAAFSICLWDYTQEPKPLDSSSYLIVFLCSPKTHHLPRFSNL